MTNIEIVLFDGFDEMDAIAPYEVFRTAANHGAPIHAELVGAHGPATITASYGTRIVVDRGPSEAADVLLVPGGGWFEGDGIRAEIDRRDLPRLLADAHARGTIIGSVCTGAMLLAATGLTAGRRATTHRFAIDDLRASGAEIVDARFVDDGDLVTAGGVTAGLDLALHLVERFSDSHVTAAVATEMSTIKPRSTVSYAIQYLIFRRSKISGPRPLAGGERAPRGSGPASARTPRGRTAGTPGPRRQRARTAQCARRRPGRTADRRSATRAANASQPPVRRVPGGPLAVLQA